MSDSSSISAASPAVIETLRALLAVETGSIFRFMGEGWPYLTRATVEIRKPLMQMVDGCDSRAQRLADMIDRLGGEPMLRPVQPEDQYLAFLDLKYLLPRLIGAKRVMIQRYESAVRELVAAPPDVGELVKSHLAEHRSDLQLLERAWKDGSAAKLED